MQNRVIKAVGNFPLGTEGNPHFRPWGRCPGGEDVQAKLQKRASSAQSLNTRRRVEGGGKREKCESEG